MLVRKNAGLYIFKRVAHSVKLTVDQSDPFGMKIATTIIPGAEISSGNAP